MKNNSNKSTELIQIFKKLKKIFEKYETPLNPKINLKEKYELWTDKEIEKQINDALQKGYKLYEKNKYI